MHRNPERCYCGDPECGACFPYSPPEQDPDEAYDQMRADRDYDTALDRRSEK